MTNAPSYKQLQERLEAIAAECSDLKNAHAAVLEHISVTDKGPAGTAAMIANDALHNTATPAATAVLAEMEARGVEKFADAWDAKTAKIMECAFFYGQIEPREAFSKCVRGYLVDLREGRV
ncbi:hypothetical protein [Serratia fonticola]|uniref:hypothetical protein n=1 Tax=Serratia fonticola TaxID=47917 RepID=UPI00217C4ED3|nr:hypothetical protein [Serratia fonticola]CAI1687355.1 Uncharacterised protein [Serratia fonticola]